MRSGLVVGALALLVAGSARAQEAPVNPTKDARVGDWCGFRESGTDARGARSTGVAASQVTEVTSGSVVSQDPWDPPSRSCGGGRGPLNGMRPRKPALTIVELLYQEPQLCIVKDLKISDATRTV